jgi:hypothetical protein
MASLASNPPAHWGDVCPEIRVVGNAPGCAAVGQAPQLVAVGYSCAVLGLAEVARLPHHLPWYLHRQLL